MYTNKILESITALGTVPTTGTLIGALTTTAQFPYAWQVNSQIGVSRVFFTVTQTFKGTAGATIPIQLIRCPVFNSTSASVVMTQLNIPTTAVVGSTFYKEVNPSIASTGVGTAVGPSGGGLVPAGYFIIPQFTTAPSSGGGVFNFECEYNVESPKNFAPLSNVILNDV